MIRFRLLFLLSAFLPVFLDSATCISASNGHDDYVMLPELRVSSGHREVLHLKATVREYSTLTTYSDTVLLFREKDVDFMIPAKRLMARYDGWLTPRILNSRSYYHFTDEYGLDSVSNRYSQHFSWSDWMGLFKSRSVPRALRDGLVSTDTVKGKYSPALIWEKHDEDVILKVNVLADSENERLLPEVFQLFRKRVDFTCFNITYSFSDVSGPEVMADNISHLSFEIESEGRGRGVRNYFRPDETLWINTRADMFVTDREYITLSEAKKREKDPGRAESAGYLKNSYLPELPDEIIALIARVDSIDPEKYKLVQKADRRYAGKAIPATYQKPPSIFKKILSKIGDF